MYVFMHYFNYATSWRNRVWGCRILGPSATCSFIPNSLTSPTLLAHIHEIRRTLGILISIYCVPILLGRLSTGFWHWLARSTLLVHPRSWPGHLTCRRQRCVSASSESMATPSAQRTNCHCVAPRDWRDFLGCHLRHLVASIGVDGIVRLSARRRRP
ncbi:hypothetical protein F5Y01DRAFT_199840 [Xylaria sp. FL0043]|nr:hypothetical protein F5Y01DRAFT_199840 [Xylaria sp. FL0043]